MSIRRETPRPRGRVPSTAAWTMSGARKAREIPMRADRSLTPSRAAIASTPTTLREAISSSHRRPLAMADKSFLLASARIGLAPLADSLGGRMTSRLRRKVCGDHGITITLEGRSEPSRNRISVDREKRVILSTSVAIFSIRSTASPSQSGLNTSADGGLDRSSICFDGGRAPMASRTIRSTASAATRGIGLASSFRPWARTQEA